MTEFSGRQSAPGGSFYLELENTYDTTEETGIGRKYSVDVTWNCA